MKDYPSKMDGDKDMNSYEDEEQYVSKSDKATTKNLAEHYDDKRRFSFKEIERKYKKVAHVGRDRKG